MVSVLNNFFLSEPISLYVTISIILVVLSAVCYGPFPSGCKFLEIPFCVVNFGIKLMFRFLSL